MEYWVNGFYIDSFFPSFTVSIVLCFVSCTSNQSNLIWMMTIDYKKVGFLYFVRSSKHIVMSISV